MTIGQFLHDLHLNQILGRTDRQSLNGRMTILLKIVPLEKKNLSNKKKYENRKISLKNIDELTFKTYIYIHIFRRIL